ncbi:hypothetical protein COP2_027468 [Malus domestica]
MQHSGQSAAADLQGPDLEGRSNTPKLRFGGRSHSSYGSWFCTSCLSKHWGCDQWWSC